MIKTTSYDQEEILANIIKLYCPAGFYLDPTYSKGAFYKSGKIPQPIIKSDLFPQDEGICCFEASKIPLSDNSVENIIFDPPFVAGHTKEKPTGIMGERFHGFPYVKDLWAWYDLCIKEHYRLLMPKGYYIFKCQDTVSSGKQHLSHVHIINEAEKAGFYTKDLFILLAKSRIIGHNHAIQKHARKFHSYFIVLQKV